MRMPNKEYKLNNTVTVTKKQVQNINGGQEKRADEELESVRVVSR